MRTLLFVFSFRILLLWLHFRIEFSISELCSIWIVKIIMFTIVNDEDVDKEDEDNNDCDYDFGDEFCWRWRWCFCWWQWRWWSQCFWWVPLLNELHLLSALRCLSTFWSSCHSKWRRHLSLHIKARNVIVTIIIICIMVVLKQFPNCHIPSLLPNYIWVFV